MNPASNDITPTDVPKHNFVQQSRWRQCYPSLRFQVRGYANPKNGNASGFKILKMMPLLKPLSWNFCTTVLGLRAVQMLPTPITVMTMAVMSWKFCTINGLLVINIQIEWPATCTDIQWWQRPTQTASCFSFYLPTRAAAPKDWGVPFGMEPRKLQNVPIKNTQNKSLIRPHPVPLRREGDSILGCLNIPIFFSLQVTCALIKIFFVKVSFFWPRWMWHKAHRACDLLR